MSDCHPPSVSVLILQAFLEIILLPETITVPTWKLLKINAWKMKSFRLGAQQYPLFTLGVMIRQVYSPKI